MKRISLILCCIICIILSGCTDSNGKYTKLNIDFNLAGNEDARVAYADETKAIYIVRERVEGEISGKTNINHSRIVMYDYAKNDIVQEIQVNDYKVNHISDVTPYQNGIIYANYTYAQNEIPGSTQWTIQYYDGKKMHRLRDGKTIDSFATVPRLAKIGDVPIVSYQLSENGESTFIIEKVSDSKLVRLWEDHDYVQTDDPIKTNGSEYCIMVYKEGNDYASLILGNESEIKFVYDLKDVINTFAVTKEHIVCSLGDLGEGKLFTMAMETKEEHEEKVISQFFRFVGSDDNCVLGVDSAFTLHRINAETCSADIIERPEDMKEDRMPINLFHTQGRTYIANFYDYDDQRLYKLRV